MKRQSFRITAVVLSILVITAATAFAAGQIVTDGIRQWAREAVEAESAIRTSDIPNNTVAVLYFENQTGKADLKLLEKGLTLMLITDLSKIETLQIVERVKLQALMTEMDLSVSGIVAEYTAIRVGRLLGAKHLVGGIIDDTQAEQFEILSDVLDTDPRNVIGRPKTEGKLLSELIRMEKELLFKIVRLLSITLTPELEKKLKEPFTENLDAFRYYMQAIEYLDNREYSKADENYQKALDADPNLFQARDGMLELRKLDLVARDWRMDSPRETPPELITRQQTRELVEDQTGKETAILQQGRIKVDWEIEGTETAATALGHDTAGTDRNGGGYLPYAVQKEQAQFDTARREALARRDVWDGIDTALDNAALRERDAAFVRSADAHTGQVLKDSNGYWVRVRQYVLRPDPQSVRMLNISMRQGNGPLAGLSSIDWTTTLDNPYTGNLRDLPWGSWLNTRTDNGRHIEYAADAYPEIHPANMSVQFRNTARETLSESRTFGAPVQSAAMKRQAIENEQLRLGNTAVAYEYTAGQPDALQYTVTANTDGGFNYVLGDGNSDIPVVFNIVGDGDTPGNNDKPAFTDIWSALNVNETGAGRIGDNNLEIRIDPGRDVFSAPIDVVYIPLSRMHWNE